MAFLKKYAFQIALVCLILLMGGYLLYTYVLKPEAPLTIKQEAPSFELTDVDGNPVSLESTNGKARIVYFYFASCPDVCPPTTYLLGEVQDILREKGELGDKVELISITFDPETDTPEVIKDFAERSGAEMESWRFLRGENKEDMIALAREFGVAVIYDEEKKTFYHTNVITLVDQDGNIREWINGSPNLEAGDPDILPEDIYKQVKKLY
ncbi:hypothetical protein J40TS1_13610 [Paenibacillus montaniterrae]|uniref:Thioredoxin domain-containing protein n=1 Tax=Paenibacillus montaniterrae TaxID=429341 RepID=A0A919YP67_9BACL|nr:SCO family protein [Paenibacillus montaniterrae]GIP15719.1 hypothetical protein J40TS1_13610 [Paenibacillus montaniterrae]